MRPTSSSQVESLRFDRHGNLLATYNGGVSYWRFDRSQEEKQELALPYAGACLCGDVTPGGRALAASQGGRGGGRAGAACTQGWRCAGLACHVARCVAPTLPADVPMPPAPLAPAGMDYIVAGCHDSTVHIYHFKKQRKSGVELQARAPGRGGAQPWCLPSCCTGAPA